MVRLLSKCSLCNSHDCFNPAVLIQLLLVLQMSYTCSSSLKCLVIKLNLTSSQFSTRMKTPTLCSVLKLHYCWQRSALFLSKDFSFTEVHLRFSFGPFIQSTTIRDHNSHGFLGPRQPAHEQLCKTSSIHKFTNTDEYSPGKTTRAYSTEMLHRQVA